MRRIAGYAASLSLTLGSACGSASSTAIQGTSSARAAVASRPPLRGKAAYSFDDDSEGARARDWVLSPSEDAIVVASDGSDTFAVYDVPSGKKRFTVSEPGIMREFGFSTDGSFIWMSTDDCVATFDAHTGAQLALVPVPDHSFTKLWTPDGATVVVLERDDGALRALDGATLKERWRANAGNTKDSLFLTRSGERVVSVRQEARYDLRVGFPGVEWDIKTGERLGEIAGGTGPLRRVALSPDGRTAVLESDDHNVFRLVDALSGKKIAEFKLPGTVESTAMGQVMPGSAKPTQVERESFTPDGKTLLVMSQTPNSPLWQDALFDVSAIDVATGRVEWKIPRALGYEGGTIRPGMVLPRSDDARDGGDVAPTHAAPVHWGAQRDRYRLSVVDISSGAVAFSIPDEAAKPGVRAKPEMDWKSMRVVFRERLAGVVDLTTGKLVPRARTTSSVPTEPEVSRDISPDGTTVAVYERNPQAVDSPAELALYDAKTMTKLRSLPTYGAGSHWLPGGTIGIGRGLHVDVCDERTGELRGGFDLPAKANDWSFDGAFALLDNGEVWDTKQKKSHFKASSRWGRFSRDGSVLVISDLGWTAYKTSDGTTAGQGAKSMRETVSSVSDDGRFIAFDTWHGVRLVRIDNGKGLELHLVRTDAGVEPIFVLDTGHFSASKEARSHITLKTDQGDLSGDAPDNAFGRDDVWLDFLALP